ncbi:putative uncharacterized protein PQLC2L [Puma concolor]|uniref:Uncharacterized protein n=1 Tax=Puma concolor TaxID=9696 RepID=A0A6P6H118_PUMCO|nr:putative uncharacterized protein PQLC2L [Puma concolor]
MAYRNGKVDETLSPGFQRCWIGGDLAKFMGCYLTNQLSIEIFTAPDFYMNMDISVLSQFMYYKLKNQKKNVSDLNFTDEKTEVFMN